MPLLLFKDIWDKKKGFLFKREGKSIIYITKYYYKKCLCIMWLLRVIETTRYQKKNLPAKQKKKLKFAMTKITKNVSYDY